MSGMVELVAQAIAAMLIAEDSPCSFARQEDDGAFTLDGIFDPKDIARVAIAALREPTPEMFEAMSAAIGNRDPGPTVAAWYVMIETALGEVA